MKHTIIAGVLLLGLATITFTGDEFPHKDTRNKQCKIPKKNVADELEKSPPIDKKQMPSSERRRRKAEADRFIKQINKEQ